MISNLVLIRKLANQLTTKPLKFFISPCQKIIGTGTKNTISPLIHS
jgi:hypothetical protein